MACECAWFSRDEAQTLNQDPQSGCFYSYTTEEYVSLGIGACSIC